VAVVLVAAGDPAAAGGAAAMRQYMGPAGAAAPTQGRVHSLPWCRHIPMLLMH
jgi:hypothetical protein